MKDLERQPRHGGLMGGTGEEPWPQEEASEGVLMKVQKYKLMNR